MSGPRVAAVVVAFNRAELLTKCLDAIGAQSRPVDAVVAVDNASTDETPQVLAQHPVVTDLVTLPRNTGGAGGFAAGIARALADPKVDLLWIMDDDTIAEPEALETLVEAWDDYPGAPAVLSSRAIWTDGRTHPMNTHRQRPFSSPTLVAHAAEVGAVPVRAASFVSILIDARAARAEGLPEADYFIWNDDLEYTARLLRRRVGLYVPDSVALHETKAFASATEDPGERFYYEARNKIWFLLGSQGLHLLDRALYGASMVVRWTRMLLGSSDRRALAQRGWRGIRDALADPPRPNSAIFADTEVAEDVIRAERGAGRA